jgi:hypothetical protein
MRRAIVTVSLLTLSLLSACGRYGSPLSPELLAPRAVQKLEVLPDISGVRLTWQAPETDLRGRELRRLDSYRVYRAVVSDSTQALTDGALDYELLSSLEDRHLFDRERLRDEADAAGRSARKVESDKTAGLFSFLDSNVSNNSVYVYKVVPVNQGNVLGAFDRLIRVHFKSSGSEVRLLANESASLAEGEDLED